MYSFHIIKIPLGPFGGAVRSGMTEGLRKGEMMALGAVQPGYAGVTDAAYRQRNRVQEGDGNLSFAAQMMKCESENDPVQQIRKRMEELFDRMKKGETETTFQIGNSTFTIKEWERFLERFDDIEDAIRELMRERIEKRKDEAEEEAIREKETSSEIMEEAGGIF